MKAAGTQEGRPNDERTESDQREPGIWNPGRVSLWTQSWSDPNDEHPSSVMLRHPTAPFVRFLDKDDGSLLNFSESDLQEISFEYLSQVNERGYIDPRLPRPWLEALGPGQEDFGFGWLPIGWPPNRR